ncbi:hypothetical protein [Thiohalorhabdus methylotrophus]|uniref:Uncharacterized protein n=1 Tax=Thiohalorhabdus methylotrophus TaxID=3242694 RepID=A0ABV4TS73_9GAMM
MPSITEDHASPAFSSLPEEEPDSPQDALYSEWALPALERLPILNQITALYSSLASSGLQAVVSGLKGMLTTLLAGL